MRIVVTGATGNLGTSVLQALARDSDIDEVVGLARRAPRLLVPRTEFRVADVGHDPLEPIFGGADVVIHLAWQLQPSHRPDLLETTNVHGSERVFEAAARTGVSALIYASSIGAYSGGSKERLVDESWPTMGIPSSLYGRQKSRVEEILDDVERASPGMRVVRMRPGLVFKREAASDIRRLFVGPLVPRFLFDPRVIRVVPDHPRLRFQAVHSLDVGEAFRLAARRDVRGAFNLVADPILDSAAIAELFGARRVRMGPGFLRGAVGLAWRMHLLASSAGWIDLAFGVPLLDARRAREELGWRPTRAADAALLELVQGLREGAGIDTPPLAPRRGLSLAAAADPQSLRGRMVQAGAAPS